MQSLVCLLKGELITLCCISFADNIQNKQTRQVDVFNLMIMKTKRYYRKSNKGIKCQGEGFLHKNKTTRVVLDP